MLLVSLRDSTRLKRVEVYLVSAHPDSQRCSEIRAKQRRLPKPGRGGSPPSSASLSGALGQNDDRGGRPLCPESDTGKSRRKTLRTQDVSVHQASSPGLPDGVQMAAEKPSIPAWLI